LRAESGGRSLDATVLVFRDQPVQPVSLPTNAVRRPIARAIVHTPGHPNGDFQEIAEALSIARRFDPEYYKHEYPDIDFSKIEPMAHFLEIGWYEGRNPNAFFDTVSYLQNYPDIEKANVNPYCHYLAVGATEGRRTWSSVTPSTRARLLFGRPIVDWVARIAPHVDLEFYQKQFQKPAPAGVNLVAHYAFRGWREARRPNPQFDPATVDSHEVLKRYLVNPLLIQIESLERNWTSQPAGAPPAAGDDQSPEIAAPVVGIEFGGSADAKPGEREPLQAVAAEFDAEFYGAQYSDVAEAGISPLEHFFYTGWREGRNPNAQFDTRYYLEAYPDVRAADANPFWHYLSVGRAEGRLGRAAEPAIVLPEQEAVGPTNPADQLALVRSEFDAAYYLAAYPDVANAGIDPLQHFFFTGWREGRNPNPTFDSRYYLSANEDVRDAGLNPFWHFLVSGRDEGRLARRPGGYKRANIDAAIVPSARPPADLDPDEGEISAAQLTTWLDKIRKKHRTGLVVSLSHDCYTRVIGGTQIFISDEQKRFNAKGCGYIHLSPRLARLSLAPKSTRFQVRIVADGEYVGLLDLKSVASCLKSKRGTKRSERAVFVVHCALGFNVDDIVRLWKSFHPDKSVYWLHDYSSLCPGFNLMRNDAEFCGAPPKDSLACRICVYGQERRSHLSQMGTLFEACNFNVLSPSQYTLSLWLRSTELPRRSAAVHPHWQLQPVEGKKASAEGEDVPLPIAFLGYPSANKGWQIFEEIVRRLGDDDNIRFFHFAARNVATLSKVEFVATEVTPGNRQAAQAALADRGIRVLLLLSPWPETFSFVLHEAIAAGAYVFCLADSGNVAEVVAREKVGKVFSDVDALIDFVGSKAAAFVRKADATRPVYKIKNSGTSATASVVALRSLKAS
jgi:hypothetical protein